ncbi:MAG: PEP-CTERM sorting domain-containing protein [Sedimentisphaerales bacterium]|jgi:hypothetical protein
MKRLATTCAVVTLLLVISSVANATLYVETFSNGNAGWLSVTNNGGTSSAAYSSTDGNPAGSISCSLTTTVPLGMGLEASQIWGGSGSSNVVQTTWGDITGDTLTADFKTDGGTITTQDGKDPIVRFYVGDDTGTYFITTDAYSWNPNGDTSWTTHQVVLSAVNFVREAGSESFAVLITRLNDIGLQFGPSNGESYTGVGNLGFVGNATLNLDNFGTVPEPATMGLLGLGALSLLRKRRA